MMKFRFRRPGNDPQREKLKLELFAFNKTVEHGFPNQPSSLAHDPKLRLMAIATKSGAVKIYGAPGVEFTGLHREAATVTQMYFLPGQGRLLSLLDDNSVHLWEINQRNSYSYLEEICTLTLPGRLGFDCANSPNITRITVIMLKSCCSMAFLGSEGGGVYFLDLTSLQLMDGKTLFQDEVLQSLPDDYKCGKALGPVESLQEHPADPDKILIGYSRGLVILWGQATRSVENLFLGNQQLESISWERSSRTFVSSHSDGGYMVWPIDGSKCKTQPLTTSVPYGPFPCKAINKILWRTSETGSPFVIFSGGMPRASYGDRHCITIMQGKVQVTLDFTSRVIDFFTVHNTDPEQEYDNPTVLIVLVEEELVAVDLHTAGWPTITPPYLAPLHSSAITCSYHISNIPVKLWERLICAGKQQSPRHSTVEWPINGGKNLAPEPLHNELLLTGHEDGTVRFWDASSVSLKSLYKLTTASIFQTEADHNEGFPQPGEEEWPPFRKVGCFDPYSDDPRLGIQKICLCKYSSQLVIAGTAGQVLVMEFHDEKSEQKINLSSVDLLQDREGFTWKGHDRLIPKSGLVSFAPGFQPNFLVQCIPPAAVTAVTLHTEWQLVAFGTSHGFGVFDYYRQQAVLARCTLHPNDSLAMEGPLSRVKSLKKSLRQSFRRIRKSRVSGKKRLTPSSPASKVQEANAQLAEQDGPREVEVTPVQRRIEPRSADDSLSGVVRCLYFADTFLRDATHHGPTMWAGTNAGSVYAYALEVPSREKWMEKSAEAVLGKEIQLMHRAPVVSIAVLDGRGNPLPEPFEVSRDLAKAPEMQGTHSVLIISEEQFKVFMLPRVTAKTKFKLTAHEGSRVRKLGLVSFPSVASDDYSENCLVCLTNLGDIHIFTIPGLRPQMRYDCIRKEDISGVASCVFTKTGQGFYLISPSEFERFSLSARNITEPHCVVGWESSRDHLSPITSLRNNLQGSPKMSQANGTHKPRNKEECNSLGAADGMLEDLQLPLSQTPLDSPNSSADITLDTTGDLTVEDVKDYLPEYQNL
ncbi:lethal(2) giant larvae protein homolog 1 isoform X1 [Stegostoma tigrinum]|uniref:lethal(2) giant larvae protein homolog 1 isoform X1 n=1 Tax=Stegostoma tigrinum TaxID=3053191 RepID=UPI002870A026|nr:lethal(2) giant larvae protein homolog 1 isoform X1 [Stegostoma tigrinum]